MAIISPRSLSFDEVKTDLLTYIQSRPDYSRWQDFMSSSAGTIVVEILAGLGVFNSFHAIATRRESYIDTALLRSSLLNIAIMLGYPVNRESSPRLKFVCKGMSGPITDWERVNPVAYYGTRPISLIPETDTETIAQNGTFYAVMGEWVSETFTTTETRDYTRIIVTDTGIENDKEWDVPSVGVRTLLRLAVDAVSQDLHDYVSDVTFTGALIRTHPDGVVFVFGEEISSGIDIDFEYIKTEGALSGSALNTNLLSFQFPNFTVADNLDSVEVLDIGSAGDSLEKIAFTAPGYHASKRKMVTKYDHEYIFLQEAGGDIVSASYVANSSPCCSGKIAYVKNTYTYAEMDIVSPPHILTSGEKDTILAAIDEYRVVPEEITIEDPDFIGLDIQMVVLVEEGTDTAILTTDIESVITSYIYKLANHFRLWNIRRDVGLLDGVQRVTILKPTSDLDLSDSGIYVNGWKTFLCEHTYTITLTTNPDYPFPVIPTWDTGYVTP